MKAEIYQRLVQGEPGHLSLVDRALFTLSGPDRIRYLNGQITNDLSHLVPGQGLYAALLTGKGRMVSDLFVSASGDTLWIDAPLLLRTQVQQRLSKFLIADDAELTDVTEQYTLIHLFSATRPASVPGYQQARFGLPGFDCWLKKDQPHDLTPLLVSEEVAETLRIECGWGRWGAELDESTLPQEANFEPRGLSYDKGCYVGQETVARIRSIGHVNRRLSTLELGEGLPPSVPAPLTVDGVEAGKLTSLTYSPLIPKPLALGFILRKFDQPDQQFSSHNSLWKVISPPRSV